MSYGLQIFGPSGQTWFDSNLAEAGVPVDYISVPGATYDGSSWTAGSYANTYTSYSHFTLKAVYLSNMYLDVTVTSGPAITNPDISITNYGVSTATVLLVATASA